MRAGSTTVTGTEVDSTLPSSVAVTTRVVAPVVSAVTAPPWETLATSGFVEVYATPASVTTVPMLSRTVTAACVVEPRLTLEPRPSTETDLITVRGTTGAGAVAS
jgi:hypothetical protein